MKERKKWKNRRKRLYKKERKKEERKKERERENFFFVDNQVHKWRDIKQISDL
jgi:hypothetical protein